MTGLEIRSATAEEFATAIDWAAAEGWNPGLDDLPVFHQTDPDGFLMGFLDGKPVSSISVVRYGGNYGFLGFYIVAAEHRGTGVGFATWNAGLAHLAGRTVGLDGVVAQQDNYRKSGFVLAGRNIRYTGRPELEPVGTSDAVRPVAMTDLDAITAYDRNFFPAPRDIFVKSWVLSHEGARREGLVYIADGNIAGYGVIRECRSGFKIGPLFADDEPVAAALFKALCREVPPGTDLSLDVPEANNAAVRMAENAGMSPVFETARMYKGIAPELPLARIFGITTFELG
jgi:hypothetical protein